MNGLYPVVRSLIGCEDILIDPQRQKGPTLVTLLHEIRSAAQPPFPMRHPDFCVLVQLTECRGSGTVAIRVVHADSGQVILATHPRRVTFK